MMVLKKCLVSFFGFSLNVEMEYNDIININLKESLKVNLLVIRSYRF